MCNSCLIDLLHLVYSPSAGEESELYVSSTNGVERDSCGWRDLPCQTISTAYEHRYTSSEELICVYLMSGNHTTESNSTTFTQSTRIEPVNVSEGSVNKSVSSLSDPSLSVFVVSTQSITVTFTSLTFQIDSLTSPLFTQTFGSLSLQSLTVASSSSTTITSSVVMILPITGSVTVTTINESTFSNLNLVSGNGSAFSSTSNGVTNMTMHNVVFKSCTATNGYGGGVYCVYSNTSSYSLSNLTFTSCNDKQSSSNGFFISAQNVDVLTPFSGWTDILPSSSYSLESEGIFTVEITSNSSLISLIHLFFTPSQGSKSEMHISTAGDDYTICGWSDLPWHTICGALSHSGESTSILLSQGTHSSEENTITPSSSVTINGQGTSARTNAPSIYSFGSPFASSQYGFSTDTSDSL